MSVEVDLSWREHGEYWELSWSRDASCWALVQFLGEASVELLTQWAEIRLAPRGHGDPVIRARASASQGIAATHALATEVERGPRWLVLTEHVPILLATYQGCLTVSRRGDEQGCILGAWSPDWVAWIDVQVELAQLLRQEDAQPGLVGRHICGHCHRTLDGPWVETVPDDDATWAALAALHAPDCEWILTRGIPW